MQKHQDMVSCGGRGLSTARWLWFLGANSALASVGLILSIVASEEPNPWVSSTIVSSLGLLYSLPTAPD